MRFEPDEDGPMQFSAIILEINETTHKVTKIDTVHVIE